MANAMPNDNTEPRIKSNVSVVALKACRTAKHYDGQILLCNSKNIVDEVRSKKIQVQRTIRTKRATSAVPRLL
jgi:hypothetical protein